MSAAVALLVEGGLEVAHRKRRGSAGGRPPAFDAEAYEGRNVIERRFCHLKQRRSLATRYDSPSSTAPPPSSTPSSPGHEL